MRLCRLAVLVVLAGCGEGAATPAKAPPAEAVFAPKIARPGPAAPSSEGAAVTQPPAPKQAGSASAPATAAEPSVAALPSAPVGHLEHPDHLAHLFEALAALDGGHAHDDVRILQYGDSHTASDAGVSVFRRALQARFGDGGRGFVSIGKPWKTYWQDGVRGGMTPDFQAAKVKFHAGSPSGLGGAYGLLGVGIEASSPGARAWTDVRVPTSHVEIDYWQQPRGGSFDLFIDGARAARITTRAPQPGSGFLGFDVADAPHAVEVRAVGDGDVRVFGMTLDRAEAGVVVDTLGINGAQIFTPLQWNQQQFEEQLRHRAPDLVVLAYGTNEALDADLTDAQLERGIVELLGRIERAAPTASCLLLGPPDLARRARGRSEWRTWPRIGEIVAAERRVAQAAGCAFFDQMAAMGGPGTIAQWAAEPDPRAARDRVHMKRTGYALLATAFADDLLRAYDEWRAARGLPPTGTPRTWGVASR